MVLRAIGVLLVVFSESLGDCERVRHEHGYEVEADPGTERSTPSPTRKRAFGRMIVGEQSASAVRKGAGHDGGETW